MELNEIKYRFVVDLTKYFVGKYKDGEIKDLNLIIRNVKSLSSFIREMDYIYDETIWYPDRPDTYKNLIKFRIQFHNTLAHLPFRLYLSEGANQEPIYY